MKTPSPIPPPSSGPPVAPVFEPRARIEATFNSALSLPAEEQDAFVVNACPDDEDLQAQVRALLEAHRAAGDFMEDAPVPPEVEAELARLKPEEDGDMIGPYKLREQIGEGGFGTVWVADQERPVRRRVALKLLKAGMDTKEVIARFDQERQALAMMDHPNIAKVLDAGATQYGRPFFVMELVRGVPITDYCDGQQLSTDERIELFVTVCAAVQHAHQKGIIHRDIKPSNVLVTINDGKAVPKVIDFGVAKATQGRLVDQTVYTQFQQMIGTPLYMSPEQAELTSLDIDTRSDIYSLGVLLYELLTGHTPIDQKTMARMGMDEVRRIIREVDPPRPSLRVKTFDGNELTTMAKRRHTDPAKLPGTLRGDLDWIVMKCLEKDRQRRYETANGLALDLQRHLNNEVVIARPPTAGYLLSKLMRRHKLAFAAGAAVAAALVIGIAGTTFGLIRANSSAAAERIAKQDAQAKSAEAVKQQHRAEDNGRKAAEAEKKATEQATASGLLANYVNAKYLLSQGRIEPAYGAIRTAISTRPHWEYGNLLSEIVSTARKHWRPVARFEVTTEPPPAATFVGPGSQILALVSGTRLQLFDVPSSRLRSETDLGITGATPIRIGERELGVTNANTLRIHSIDDLTKSRSPALKGDLKLAIADPAGRLLAVLSSNGDTTIYDATTLKPLAEHRFKVVASLPAGVQPTPSLGFSPSGKRLIFTSGLWTNPSSIWDWAEDAVIDRELGQVSFAEFLDEQTMVSVRRWDSVAEDFSFGMASLNNPAAPSEVIYFTSRASRNPVSWHAMGADGKPAILAASTSSDSIDLFSLSDKEMLHSTRLATLLPTSPAEPRFLAFSPVSYLLAVAGDKEVTVFQSTGHGISKAPGVTSEVIDYWSIGATDSSMLTAAVSRDEAKEPHLKVVRRSFLDESSTVFRCQWPKADEGKGADVWGITATPDGSTVAVLWQEDSGNGYVDSSFYRKAILIYQFGPAPDSAGQLMPKSTIWLDKYEGSNGRNNRAICLSPDGQTVAYFSSNGEGSIYRAEDGGVVADIKVGTSISISPDGSLFAGGSHQKSQPVRVWHTASGKPLFSTPVSGEVRTFAISRDNQKLYVGWSTDVLECFDIASGQSLSKINTKISPLAISPRGDRFVGFLPDRSSKSNVNGSMVLGSLADGQAVFSFNEGAHVLNRAYFSQSGDGVAYTKSRNSAGMTRSLTLDQAAAQLDRLTPYVSPTQSSIAQLAELIQASWDVKKPGEALPFVEEKLRLQRAALGPDHADTLYSLNELGVVYWHIKQFDKAISTFEEALKLREAKFGRNDPETQLIVANLGVNYKDSGRLQEAMPLLEEAYRSAKTDPSRAWVGDQLLDACKVSRDKARLITFLPQRLAEVRERFLKDKAQLAWQLASLGDSLLMVGSFAEAEPLFRESLAIREKQWPNDWNTFNTLSLVGDSLFGQKKFTEAEPLLVKGYEGMKQREASIPPESTRRLAAALDRIVELFTATDKADEVKKWKAERAKYPQAAAAPGR